MRSGQVKVEYENRNKQRILMWTHLDNKYEIDYKQTKLNLSNNNSS